MGDEKKFSVEVIRANVPTHNGRVYSREVLEKAAAKFRKESFCPVVCRNGEPVNGLVKLADVVGFAENVSVDDGVMTADIRILPGEKEVMLSSMLEAELVKTLTVGIGTVGEDGSVGDDYEMKALSLVQRDGSGETIRMGWDFAEMEIDELPEDKN